MIWKCVDARDPFIFNLVNGLLQADHSQLIRTGPDMNTHPPRHSCSFYQSTGTKAPQMLAALSIPYYTTARERITCKGKGFRRDKSSSTAMHNPALFNFNYAHRDPSVFFLIIKPSNRRLWKVTSYSCAAVIFVFMDFHFAAKNLRRETSR